jgi:hypothetical protein
LAKVRFLQSVYLVSENHVFGYNDETEINDEKIIASLVKKGIVDVLVEEEKPAPKKPSTRKRQAKKDE